jgi:hypothetical protein
MGVSRIAWRWALLAAAGVTLGAGPRAEAQVVLWANGVLAAPSGRGPYVTGAPDGESGSLTDVDWVMVNRFRGGFHPGLAALLGVSEDVLDSADVIAFDMQNCGHGGGPTNGWESSSWKFSDGTSALWVEYDERVFDPSTIPGVVASGMIPGRAPAYNAFFGLAPPPPSDCPPGWPEGRIVSYILFKLPGVDTSSPFFRIYVIGAPGRGEGTPDLDAVGVLGCDRASFFK